MAIRLMRLDEERWGERIRRARERAGLTVREAADLVSQIHETSYRSIARLEELHVPPTGRRQLLAYLALLAYGYDPDDFGLGDSPASKLVNRREVIRAIAESSRCNWSGARQQAYPQPMAAATTQRRRCDRPLRPVRPASRPRRQRALT